MFAAVAAARARHGARALDTVIVSATERPADVLGVLELTDEPVAVVPLFETIADLEAAAGDRRARCSPTPATAPGSPSAAAGSR